MKQLIKKYLKKKLNKSHPKHYYFLRWLANIVMDKEQTKDVCASIARWMYDNKYNLQKLPLNDIFVLDNKIYIYTFRPGLWIGKAGSTVYSCEDSINHNVNGVKVHNYEIHFIEIHKTPFTELYGFLVSYENYY